MKDDQEILKQIRLSLDETKDLLRKFNSFIRSLNEQQQRAFMRNQPSMEQGAKTLRDVSASELEAFLRKCAPPDGIICILGNLFNGPTPPPPPPTNTKGS